MIKKIILSVFTLIVLITAATAKDKKAVRVPPPTLSITISGPGSCWEGSTNNYGVTFDYKSLSGPGGLHFTAQATNGTITASDLNPLSTHMYVQVQWACNQTSGSLTVRETTTNVSTSYTVRLNSYSNTISFCQTITPLTQDVALGPTPAPITISNCSPYCYSTYNFQYQWQEADITNNPATPVYTNIAGATSADYQPPYSLVRLSKSYRRVTSGNLISPITSIAATVNYFAPLSAGYISGSGFIYLNDIPLISQSPATGGQCDPLTYSYTWERSVNNAAWEEICYTKEYTSTLPVTANTDFRRKVTCGTQQLYSNVLSYIITTPLFAGKIAVQTSPLAYGTVPVFTEIAAASGGFCFPANYVYTWERSIDNGPWVAFGTGINYPTGAILIGNSVFRRKLTCGTESKYSNVVTVDMLPYTYPNAENLNYVRINNIVVPNVQNWYQADNLPTGDKLQTTTYLDGLGRAIQKVVKQGSLRQATTPLDPNNVANYQDLVSNIEYDGLGRADKAFLPYATQTNAGFFKTNAHDEQKTFINTKYGEPVNSDYTHSQTSYDGSPLNRVTNVKLPGNAWNTDPNYKGISSDYAIYKATEGVRIWDIGYNAGDVPVVNTSVYATGIYPDFALVKNIIKDDKDKLIVEYKDLSGNVVLKKVQEKDGGNIDLNGYTGWLCTYYVYDDFNRLRYTITPKAVAAMPAGGWVIDADTKKGLCFYQEYDAKGRVIVKHSPDGGEVWLVYDNRNRTVFTQDENQRNRHLIASKNNQWSFALYDDDDRVLTTGLTDDVTIKSRADMQAMVDNLSLTAQNKTLAVYTGNAGATENITAYNPVAGNNGGTEVCSYCSYTTLNSINYYDTYNSNSKAYIATTAGDFAPTNSLYKEQAAGPSSRTKGMVTTTKIRVLDDSYATANPLDDKFLSSTVFIDEKGRVIQTQSENIKGGTDVAAVQYDFAGKALSTNTKHVVPGSPFNNMITITKNEYDLLGSPVQLLKLYTLTPADISNLAKYKKLSSINFDEFGRARTKAIGNDPANSGSPIETMDYSYNIQGWLTGINKDYALADGTNSTMTTQWSRHFGMYLDYENADGKLSGAAAKQWSGNIAGAIWRSQGDNTPRKYEYEYDNINRFTAARFTQKATPSGSAAWDNSTVDLSVSISGYDANGNIAGMLQTGIVPGTAGGVVIDNLQYQYFDKSNKLKAVNDLAFGGNQSLNGKQGDFKDYTPGNGIDYGYDWNGNLKYDKNKTIIDPAANVTDNDPAAGITHNFLNLPEKTIIKDKSKTEYIYDASGTKLAKKVTQLIPNAPPAKTTYYVGEYVYEDNDLQYILNEEGKLRIMEPVAAWSGPSGAVNYLETHGNVQLTGTKWGVWDYFVKDNLSNTRMVLTEEYQQQVMNCSMEATPLLRKNEEEATFGNTNPNNEVANTRTTVNLPWQPSASVSKLIYTAPGVSPGTSVGPNIMLKVMAGDMVAGIAKYYYESTTASNNSNTNVLTNIVNSLFGFLQNGTNVTGVVKDGITTGFLASNGGPITPFLTNNNPQPSNPNTPKAFINYIFFDEQFRYVPECSGAVPVPQLSGSSTSIGGDMPPFLAKATKNGYVYVYLSNESNNIPVYFDDFQVTHTHGAIVDDNAYYPYGLKIQGISGHAALKPQTRYGYQGDYSEQDDETGYNEFTLRTFDPQLGRWLQTDPYDQYAAPYTGIGNDPINSVDPDGGGTDWGSRKNEDGTITHQWFDGGYEGIPDGWMWEGKELPPFLTTNGSYASLHDNGRVTWSDDFLGISSRNTPDVNWGDLSESKNINIEPIHSEQSPVLKHLQDFVISHFQSPSYLQTNFLRPVAPRNAINDYFTNNPDDFGGAWVYTVYSDIENAKASFKNGDYFDGMVHSVNTVFDYGSILSYEDINTNVRPAFVPKPMAGRLGTADTRAQIAAITEELQSRGYTITGGGGLRPEEFLKPIGGGRKGGSYLDITATHPLYGTLRINTVDVYKTGLPTMRELNNAIRIRQQIMPGEHLLLIPKK